MNILVAQRSGGGFIAPISGPDWARRFEHRIPGSDFIFPGTVLTVPNEQA